MRDTGFWTVDTHRLATACQPIPDGLAVLDEPGGKWSRPLEFGDAAAGLVSTADDLARMLLAGGAPVLPADAVRAMTTDQLTAAQKARRGLLPGFFHGRSWGFCQAVYDSGAFGNVIARLPAPARQVAGTITRAAFTTGLDRILLVAAIIAFVAGVASLAAIRSRGFARAAPGGQEGPRK